MTRQERKTYKRIGNLFRLIMGGATEGEREAARAKLDAELKKLGKTFSDMSDLLALEKQVELEEKQEQAAAQGATYDPQTDTVVNPQGIPCIDLVYEVLKLYTDLREHEYVAISLWALHTYVFERFMHTPRLTLLSPVAECGKSRVLTVLEKLVYRAEKVDDATPASVYWLLDERKRTMLLDEMDNADLMNNPNMRRVINGGFEPSGRINRQISGSLKSFSTFAPMALAAINSHRPIPFPILSRSIIINLQRSRKNLEFTSNTIEGLDLVRGQIWLWARPDLELNPNPEMPAGLRMGRPRDKWRALLSIADNFGPTWGERAREAALVFARDRREVDESVLLLEDIREIFIALNIDRIWSKTLVERLRMLENTGWDELPLTPGRLAKMLVPFDIKPKVVWPKERTRNSKSGKGYHRDQFERAWGGLLRRGRSRRATSAEKRQNQALT